MSRPRGSAVPHVDTLLRNELPSLRKAARRIAEALRDPKLNLGGSVSIVITACVVDPHRSETVHLQRKAWESVSRKRKTLERIGRR